MIFSRLQADHFSNFIYNFLKRKVKGYSRW
ncbi:hypothetical protein V6Z12_D02G278800 [Gossypium hirsutum]